MNVYDADDRLIHSARATVEIMSDETVCVDKMYGPLIFALVRITPVASTCEWVVERQRINTGDWVEVGRFPGQIEDEFRDAEERSGE